MYFDYAATTPPDAEVLNTFETVNRDFWANPHALYRPGIRAESLLDQARQQILALLGAERGYSCVFTSGATESNNMALKGVAQLYKNRGKHIITSAVEHPSVLEVCRFLEQEGFELTVLPANKIGCVEPEELARALRPDTLLVSLMQVNNETGAVNDIATVGQLIREKSRAVFHVDAAQAVGKLPVDLAAAPVDLLTFSAHKFFGLKGAGALILKERMEIPPLLHGGGQENGFRSGTADAARAAAMAKALRLSLKNRGEVFARVARLKCKIIEMLSGVDGAVLNGTEENASPFIVNCSIPRVRPETLLQGLAEKEIYISTVSACSAGKAPESAVVYAMTGDHEKAQTSIRISLSALTTEAEVAELCHVLGPLVETLRFKRK